MSAENPLSRGIHQKIRERYEKKTDSIVSSSLLLLEGRKSNLSLGRQVIVEVPGKDRGYRINDLRETFDTKAKISIGDPDALKKVLTIKPLRKFRSRLVETFGSLGVAFPLPFSSEYSIGKDAHRVPLTGDKRYPSLMLNRIAGDLQVAVPYIPSRYRSSK